MSMNFGAIRVVTRKTIDLYSRIPLVHLWCRAGSGVKLALFVHVLTNLVT